VGQERERLVWEDHINQLEQFYVEEMVDLFHRLVGLETYSA
jgi:hypothetical protein